MRRDRADAVPAFGRLYVIARQGYVDPETIDNLAIAVDEQPMSRTSAVVKALIPAVLGLLLPIGPLIIAVTAGLITKLFGHELHEGYAPEIPVIGELLYVMGVMGWLTFFTLPLGAVVTPLCILWSVMKLKKLWSRERT
jgi:hypothetical protein